MPPIGDAYVRCMTVMSSPARCRLSCVDIERVAIGDAPVDLALVDRLARQSLAARRRGHALVVTDPTPELVRLLVLVGLAGAIAGEPSAVEVGRQAEQREESRLEEVV